MMTNKKLLLTLNEDLLLVGVDGGQVPVPAVAADGAALLRRVLPGQFGGEEVVAHPCTGHQLLQPFSG
jgi:hypothetical protein